MACFLNFDRTFIITSLWNIYASRAKYSETRLDYFRYRFPFPPPPSSLPPPPPPRNLRRRKEFFVARRFDFKQIHVSNDRSIPPVVGPFSWKADRGHGSGLPRNWSSTQSRGSRRTHPSRLPRGYTVETSRPTYRDRNILSL